MPRATKRFRLLAALAAIIVAGAAQLCVRGDPGSAAATVSFLIAAFAAAVLLRSPCGDEVVPVGPASPARRAWPLAVAGAGTLVLLCGTALLLAGWRQWFYSGWGLLLAGTATIAAGLRLPDGPAPGNWRWSESVVLAAIVTAGAALRFHDYRDWPGPFTTHAIEEQQTGLGGFRVLARGYRPWEFWLDYHLTALALWFDPEPTFNTIRLPYTAASALTVVPVYILLRQWMGASGATFGAALYALSSWNLVYSRCAHPIFLTNILVVCVLATLFHYGRTRRLGVLAWTGLLCGYTLYSYAGYRGTPLFAMTFLLGCGARSFHGWRSAAPGVRDRWRGRVLRDAAAVVVFSVVTVATALPITSVIGPAGRHYYFEAAARSLANREYYTDDLGKLLEQRVQRIRDSARIFMHVGDGSHTFNVPGRPMLDPATAVLFTIGLFVACLEPRRRYNAFLLFVFSALMLVGTVFVQNLDVRRLQGVTVLVIAFAAMTFERLRALAGRREQKALALLGAAVVAFAGWWSYDLYFRRMAGDPAIRAAFHDQYTTLIHWGHVQTERRPILLLSFVHRFFDPTYHYRYNYSWLIDRHLTGRDLGDVTDLLRQETFAASGARTVVVQEFFERRAVAELLQTAYPGTTCSEMVEPYSARTALTVCELAQLPEPPRVRPRLAACYAFEGDSRGGWLLERHEPFLGFSTYPPVCYTPQPGLYCRGEWEGAFAVPAGEPRTVALLTNGRTQATATVDGRPVPPHGLVVEPGEHRVRVEARLPRDWEAGVRLVWRGKGMEEPIPFY